MSERKRSALRSACRSQRAATVMARISRFSLPRADEQLLAATSREPIQWPGTRVPEAFGEGSNSSKWGQLSSTVEQAGPPGAHGGPVAGAGRGGRGTTFRQQWMTFDVGRDRRAQGGLLADPELLLSMTGRTLAMLCSGSSTRFAIVSADPAGTDRKGEFGAPGFCTKREYFRPSYKFCSLVNRAIPITNSSLRRHVAKGLNLSM